jgi:multisubunit Na+/H+ antiporter MnhC subunit
VTPALALAVGLLTAVGVYLLLARRAFPAILGLTLLAHAANLVVLAGGDRGEQAPIVVEGVDGGLLADPVPQALVLTAIVISMAVTLYLLATFAVRARVFNEDELRPAWSSDAERDEESVAKELAGAGRERA